tara:strand:- start:83 stop:229 length:147 start_codon:yes stop_codon:yes gene_type:complete
MKDNFTLNKRHQCHIHGCTRYIEGDYSDKWCWKHHEEEEGVIVLPEDI